MPLLIFKKKKKVSLKKELNWHIDELVTLRYLVDNCILLSCLFGEI